ncbi:MAG: FtsX-like permease family protein [Desulfobacterales bacterium]
MALSLSSVIVVAAVPLLLSQGISTTAQRLLDNGPSMVVRRMMSGHWLPVPIEDAVRAAESVTGVLSAKPRIWGVVYGPEGAVTVMGFPCSGVESLKSFPDFKNAPHRGEAFIGPGVISATLNQEISHELLLFNGDKKLSVRMAKMLSGEHSMIIHDIVLLHEEDALELLGLERGFASDLAIDVFHEQEVEAIIPDLVNAFPWPVVITTKQDTLKMYTASGDRRAGLIYMALVPSLLALALIVIAGFKGTRSRFYEAGLLKALGWTSQDIVGFFMCKAALIAFPALALGVAVSYGLVYWPGIPWPGYLFFGWQNNPPKLYLDSVGAIWILVQVAGGVLVPYLMANLWPAIENAAADPYELLQAEGTL